MVWLVLCLIVQWEFMFILGFVIFFVGVTFGSLSDILIRIRFFNSNVFMAFRDQHKLANQVPRVGVAFMD